MSEQKETIIKKDIEIENMREFLLENQDIKLENLPKYEDLIEPRIEPKLDNLQEVNNLPFFETKVKQKQEDKSQIIYKKRFKIAVTCFSMVAVLLLSLVIINGVNLAIMSKDVKDNQKDINSLTEEVTDLQQSVEIDGSLDGEAESVSYSLALPRSYPDNTADLTWFDKLSIFLTKLFG